MKKYLILCLILAVAGCSSFRSERLSVEEGDEKAASITDKWLLTDTELAIKEILSQMEKNGSFQHYLEGFRGGRPKLFVADVKNETKDPYFPIADLNDELLTELSMSGDFILIDEQARNRLLKEITYQNDGMVNTAEAKAIGEQSGADLMIFGTISEIGDMLDGEAIKEFTVNIRMTDIQKGHEVLRARYKASKYSKRSMFGW